MWNFELLKLRYHSELFAIANVRSWPELGPSDTIAPIERGNPERIAQSDETACA
jgi:hypothetical protein